VERKKFLSLAIALFAILTVIGAAPAAETEEILTAISVPAENIAIPVNASFDVGWSLPISTTPSDFDLSAEGCDLVLEEDLKFQELDLTLDEGRKRIDIKGKMTAAVSRVFHLSVVIVSRDIITPTGVATTFTIQGLNIGDTPGYAFASATGENDIKIYPDIYSLQNDWTKYLLPGNQNRIIFPYYGNTGTQYLSYIEPDGTAGNIDYNREPGEVKNYFLNYPSAGYAEVFFTPNSAKQGDYTFEFIYQQADEFRAQRIVLQTGEPQHSSTCGVGAGLSGSAALAVCAAISRGRRRAEKRHS
jgi:hypothetical protein